MFFTKPAKSGDVLKFSSKLVYAGKSSLTVYVYVDKNGNGKPLVDGFVTFIHVDENTKPAPHLIEVFPESAEDKELFEKARELKGR